MSTITNKVTGVVGFPLHSVNCQVIFNYNDTLIEVDQDTINLVTNIVAVVIIKNNNIDESQLFVSTENILSKQQLISNLVYNTYNESEANLLTQYLKMYLAQDLASFAHCS